MSRKVSDLKQRASQSLGGSDWLYLATQNVPPVYLLQVLVLHRQFMQLFTYTVYIYITHRP